MRYDFLAPRLIDSDSRLYAAQNDGKVHDFIIGGNQKVEPALVQFPVLPVSPRQLIGVVFSEIGDPIQFHPVVLQDIPEDDQVPDSVVFQVTIPSSSSLSQQLLLTYINTSFFRVFKNKMYHFPFLDSSGICAEQC
jgi:hypothetical protein